MRTHTAPGIIRCITALAVAAALGAPMAAQAQSYPNKPIRFINFLPPGGNFDAFYRILTEAISPALGQPIITENRVGGNGAIAMDALARSAPDGYTLGAGSGSPLAVGPLLRPVSFDPIKSFTHLGLVFESPNVLSVSTASKINSVAQLLAYARANPGKLNFGSNGEGSANHLSLEWLKIRENVNIVHVPFKDDVGVLQAIRINDIQGTMYTYASTLSLLQSGQIKHIANLSTKRNPKAPDVPTAAEAGLPGFIVGSWGSVIGPAGMPPDIVQRVNRAMISQGEKPEVSAKLAASYDPSFSSPEESAARLADEINRWKDVIAKAKIKFQ